MQAYIKSIELVKLNNNKNHLKVTFIDLFNNVIGIIDNPKLSDDINFRKLLFGIMSSCNCFDILKLGGSNVLSKNVSIVENSRGVVEKIINEKEQSFTYLNDEYQILDFEHYQEYLEKAEIISISSMSGTFSILLKGEYFSTYYVTGNIYYGFGYPLNVESENKKNLDASTKMYRTFIESILKFYSTNDLLKLGGKKIINLPKVNVEVDATGKVIAVGNEELDHYLNITNKSYDIVKGNILDVDNEKKDNNPRIILSKIFKRS